MRAARVVKLYPAVAALLAKVDDFLPAFGISETTLGLRVMNDGRFVARLRAGANVTVRSIERLEDFMAASHPVAAAKRPQRKRAA